MFTINSYIECTTQTHRKEIPTSQYPKNKKKLLLYISNAIYVLQVFRSDEKGNKEIESKVITKGERDM